MPRNRSNHRRARRSVCLSLLLLVGAIAGAGLGADPGAAAGARGIRPTQGRAAVAPRQICAAPCSSYAIPGLAAIIERIPSSIRTCSRSHDAHTPTTATACAAWAPSGPVNVVVISHHTDAVAALTTAPDGAWRPAHGQWLVATGYISAGNGCAAQWTASQSQVELRLDAHDRRHAKFIPLDCPPASTSVVFTEAHSDAYDLKHCGGDHVSDFDAARNALVASLQAQPGTVVVWEQHTAAQYPDGCDHLVRSDGLVAYVLLKN